MRNVEKMAREMVGDGKSPNRYFVSIHDDHIYFNKETEAWESAAERDGREAEGKTIAVFNTYSEARKLFESIPLDELFRGILVRGKSIEDRLSGEVATEETREIVSFDSWEGETIGYTKKEMESRGEVFT